MIIINLISINGIIKDVMDLVKKEFSKQLTPNLYTPEIKASFEKYPSELLSERDVSRLLSRKSFLRWTSES